MQKINGILRREERLSKDSHCNIYQYQRNILALKVTDEKVHMMERLCKSWLSTFWKEQ